MKFLNNDIKRQLASMSAILDEGNIVVFGPQQPCIENKSIGLRIPMHMRNGAFVVKLDAQAGTRSTKTVTFDEPNTHSVFRRPG